MDLTFKQNNKFTKENYYLFSGTVHIGDSLIPGAKAGINLVRPSSIIV